MNPPTCPTCGAAADSMSRGIDCPAFLEPCGHFVTVEKIKPLRLAAHPLYGDGVRAHEINLDCFYSWQLVASRNGKRAPYPPAHWVLNFGKRAAAV